MAPVAFGFPSRRAIPMSRRLRALAQLKAVYMGLVGATLFSFGVALFLTLRLLWIADAVPFVADGGVAGCQVPVTQGGA